MAFCNVFNNFSYICRTFITGYFALVLRQFFFSFSTIKQTLSNKNQMCTRNNESLLREPLIEFVFIFVLSREKSSKFRNASYEHLIQLNYYSLNTN